MSFGARIFIPLATTLFASAASGCVVPTTYEYEDFSGPIAGEAFHPVSGVLEARCGTLDCHGSPFRPLRIYGKNGLRRPEANGTIANYYSGGATTTENEYRDNYDSVISLEPEILQRVLTGKDYPERLSLLRKPILAEKHKGGPVFSDNSEGYLCLKNWVLRKDFSKFCKE